MPEFKIVTEGETILSLNTVVGALIALTERSCALGSKTEISSMAQYQE